MHKYKFGGPGQLGAVPSLGLSRECLTSLGRHEPCADEPRSSAASYPCEARSVARFDRAGTPADLSVPFAIGNKRRVDVFDRAAAFWRASPGHQGDAVITPIGCEPPRGPRLGGSAHEERAGARRPGPLLSSGSAAYGSVPVIVMYAPSKPSKVSVYVKLSSVIVLASTSGGPQRRR